MADKFNFDVVRQRLKNIDISLDLANTVKNESLGNFREQGFNGKKWQEVQRRTPGTKAYRSAKGSARTRAILQGKGSGRLRRDVANSVSSGKRNNNWSYTLVVNTPYGGYHNEGTDKLPQRKFMGMTPKLNKMLLNKINQRIKDVWEI